MTAGCKTADVNAGKPLSMQILIFIRGLIFIFKIKFVIGQKFTASAITSIKLFK